MKIPESIRIGGVEYKITFEKNCRFDNKIAYGVIDYDNAVITLSENDGVDHQHRCITLWHEILHGIREHANFAIEDEENVVEILSRGIYQVLQDNGRRLFDIVDDEKEGGTHG